MVIEGLYMNYGDICPLPRLVYIDNMFLFFISV